MSLPEPQREWWFNQVGQNLLKGTVCDPENPPVLKDGYIIDMLRSIPAARDSFNRLFPLMLPEEQTRLNRLALSATYLEEDGKDREDQFQHRMNTMGVRTRMPTRRP